MKVTILTVFAVALVTIGFMGCSKNEKSPPAPSGFGDQYDGTPYRGDATGKLFTDGSLQYTWEGNATVSAIEQTADSISLVFQADFGDEGEINLKIRGQDRDGNFLLENPDEVFRVIDNDIFGQFENDAQAVSFSGDFRERHVFADVDVLFHEDTDVFPAGSTLKLAFRATREIAVEDPGTSNGGNGCTLRLVPVWSPSGMTMGMVPDCG